MSTAAENFLRRHLMPARPASSDSAPNSGFPTATFRSSAFPVIEPFPVLEGAGAASADVDLSALEAAPSAAADASAGESNIEIDLPLDIDLCLDLSVGESAPAPIVAAVAPSPSSSANTGARAPRVDLDLPLETVPAILWRSDTQAPDLDEAEPLRCDYANKSAPLNRAAQKAADALAPPPCAPAAPLADAATRWHGALDTTLAKAWAQSQLVAVLRVGTNRMPDVSAALGGDGESAALAEFTQRLTTLLEDPELKQTFAGARLQATPQAHWVILPGLRSASAAEMLARRCIETLSHPVQVGSHRLSLQAAVGISVFPHDGQQTQALLRTADVAWRHASQPGRSGYQFYAQEMESRSLRRLTLEAEFREALIANDVHLNFLPRAHTRNGGMCGAEVQLAWSPSDNNHLDTAGVLALADDVGLSELLSHWLVTRACEHLLAWSAAGLGPQRLTLPVLPGALRRSYSVQRLHEILYDHAIGLGQLVLMLTPLRGEGVSLWDPASASPTQMRQDARDWAMRLDPLRDAGFGLAIDGTSSSINSLTLLAQLPLSEFRIDLRTLAALDDEAGTLTQTVVDLGHRMRLRVIASGVENEAQFEHLCSMGVEDIQGPLLSQPLCADTWFDVLLGARHLPGSALMVMHHDEHPAVGTPPVASAVPGALKPVNEAADLFRQHLPRAPRATHRTDATAQIAAAMPAPAPMPTPEENSGPLTRAFDDLLLPPPECDISLSVSSSH